MSDAGQPPPADLVATLREATRVAVLTGAGVSAESGIPTFRDAQTGMWSKFDPMQLASPEGFEENPSRVWDWYRWRRELVGEARPNAGHEALAAMARHFRAFTLITQNVDGLHQRAGSACVLELHGNIGRTICSRTRRPIDEKWLERHAAASPPPSPHHDEGLARPDVVWFGETLAEDTLRRAFEAVEACEMLIVAGTAGEVFPAAALPGAAREAGARVVDVNPDLTPIGRAADWHLQGTSAEWLPRLAAALDSEA